MKKYVKEWVLIIRGEVFSELKVSFYPCRYNGKGEYEINGRFVFELYKTYKGVENYMKKYGYIPKEEL